MASSCLLSFVPQDELIMIDASWSEFQVLRPSAILKVKHARQESDSSSQTSTVSSSSSTAFSLGAFSGTTSIVPATDSACGKKYLMRWHQYAKKMNITFHIVDVDHGERTDEPEWYSTIVIGEYWHIACEPSRTKRNARNLTAKVALEASGVDADSLPA